MTPVVPFVSVEINSHWPSVDIAPTASVAAVAASATGVPPDDGSAMTSRPVVGLTAV